MASEAQCAYCFECLEASLEKRRPLSLAQIEELWEQYENGEDVDSELAAAQLKAESKSTEEDVQARDTKVTPDNSGATFRPAAIRRLLNPLASSSTSSASSSTPSLNSSSEASKSSSQSSLFSLPRRLARGRKSTADEEYPLFVTWNTISSRGHKSLRGCIGTFEPHELEDGLRSYALTSAFEDTRFNPISRRELTSLECDVTLLTDFESISDPMDWTVGTHGLRISFIHHNRRFGSTYLPSVAEEQGWTKEETIISLMKKAGWNGRSSEWRSVKELNVVRYQGAKVSLTFKEFKEWRSWVEETSGD